MISYQVDSRQVTMIRKDRNSSKRAADHWRQQSDQQTPSYGTEVMGIILILS